MRIIAGDFKGKKILEPQNIKTRPLKDLTKESIFNTIVHSNKFSINLEGSEILDLFSGTGSFGIECLSRKSKFVTFIENYKGILPVLEKNLINLELINKYEIIKKDILNDFEIKNFNRKFDVIFLDPPYKENKIIKIIESILKNKILKKNGIMIIHRHKKQKDIFPNSFSILDARSYGISKIIYGTYA